MAEVHQLITRYGIDEARRQAATKHERHLVEAAYRVLSEDAEKMGFTFLGFALTSLPHKPQTDLVWRREGHNLTLLLESGRQRSGKPLGLPYGSYARFILLFLQTEAIRTGSREIRAGAKHAGMARKHGSLNWWNHVQNGHGTSPRGFRAVV